MLIFSTTSILILGPLAFPQAQWADPLRIHAQLLASCKGELLEKAREEGEPHDPFCFLNDAAALVAARSTGVTVDFMSRRHAFDISRKHHGVCRELFLDRGAFRFPVIVTARAVVSLHTLEVADPRGIPRLVVVSRDDVVEPRKQEHRERGPWTITRWVGHDREARYAWRPTPKEPASREETLARIMALHGGSLRERIAARLREGHGAGDTFVRLQSSELGDEIFVHDRAVHRPFTVMGFPQIDDALMAATDPDRVPVLVDVRHWAALLWIDPGAPAGSPAPEPALIESRTWRRMRVIVDEGPASSEEGEVPRPPAPPPQPSQPPRKRMHEIDALEAIERLDRVLLDSQINELVELPAAEIDRRMAELGFFPEIEREHGPGLRARVVRAMLEDDEKQHTAASPGPAPSSPTSPNNVRRLTPRGAPRPRTRRT